MMFFLKTISIFAILAPICSAVAAVNVTDDYDYPTDGLAETLTTLMSENGYKINWSLNPNCWDDTVRINCSQGNLATTVAAIKVVPTEGSATALSNETMVQDKIPTNSWIWSMMKKKSPALMVSMIDPDNADVKVNWLKIDEGKHAFNYGMTPNFTSAVMITKVIEFDDPKNRGVYDGHSDVKEYQTSNLLWKREVIRNTSSTLVISFLSSLDSNNSHSSNETSLTGGSINITLSAYADRSFGIWLPHLSHSHKTNQFDIQLKNVTTNSGFNFSRFGLEMVMVASLNKSIKDERRRKYTNDDEHTPGTFEYDELVLNAADNDLQSYMQWKPIVYCSEERGKLGTNAHMSDSTNVTDPKKELEGTILYNFYGDKLDAMLVRKFNVTFGKAGKPGDASGFYNKTRYHAWTFTFGTGVPIEPGWSPKFVIAALVTLVVVVLACAGGAAACCYRKYRRSRSLNISNSYSRLDGAGS